MQLEDVFDAKQFSFLRVLALDAFEVTNSPLSLTSNTGQRSTYRVCTLASYPIAICCCLYICRA